jgi:hypothetical protein
VNPHFRDILFAFSAEKVEFLVVGTYALAVHGLPRVTRDTLSLFLPSRCNLKRPKLTGC